MKHILVSGLVNTETTLRIRQFPIPYYPVDYPFFGVNTTVSGVGCNIARALKTLGSRVTLLSMTGSDFSAFYIKEELQACSIGTDHILPCLQQTPASVVLYDPDGRRQVHSDLKDIQEASYPFAQISLEDADLVIACNTNFNRDLLRRAKAAGKTIATDVHVLSDIHDSYNRDFILAADILFLSDEGAGQDYQGFLHALADSCGSQIIVMGRGSKGAAMYLRDTGMIHEMPAIQVGEIVNTVGAGDALFSSFNHFYAEGLSPQEALCRAQLFASAKIGTSGASRGFVTRETVEELYDRYAGDMMI